MSTIVGTNIEVTNIKFDSDTTSMIISNTGQITAQGEGSATTNLQQGLSKAWSRLDTNDTLEDSFNIASVTDNSTGNFTETFTNAFSNDKYVMTSEGQYGSGSNDASSTGWPNGQVSITTTSFNGFFIACINSGTTFTLYDANELFIVYHGDLA